MKNLCIKVFLFLLLVSGLALIEWSRQPNTSAQTLTLKEGSTLLTSSGLVLPSSDLPRRVEFCENQAGQIRFCTARTESDKRPVMEVEFTLMPDHTVRWDEIPVGSKP